jgi:hypothetical protein
MNYQGKGTKTNTGRESLNVKHFIPISLSRILKLRTSQPQQTL